ncbi:nuclear RNA export factor 1-like [Thrips palmi]|uniref:Nuclear RNA export factor 1-like n=1 Tax=Thrips palmi TaxID=161013 RepID=A0A6P8Y7H0_THRPL|nr:nuclear RNA export factor 1-like [Thrips palmi]
MPKRGGMGRNFNKTYFEHDNRGEEVRRTVSFKSTRGNPSGSSVGGGVGVVRAYTGVGRNSLKYHKSIRNHLQYDTDVDMGGSGREKNFSNAPDGRRRMGKRGFGRRGRQSSPAPNRTFQPLPKSNTFWYRILIPFGAKYEKKWIVDSLIANIAPATFTPYGYEAPGRDVIFYVDDHQVATKLKNLYRRISTDDGHKLNILVKGFNHPIKVDDALKEVLKVVMARRFRPDVRSLDLSRFHADPDLHERFVPLNQESVLSAVLSLVVEHCPTLHAIDLSHNSIYSLEGVKSLVSKLSHLRILHLANNQMEDVTKLDPLKGLAVEELLITSNPLCARYTEQGAYVTDVRKRLRKLLKLDEVVLPPPILFDEETAQLPPSKGSYMCAEQGKDIARQFLEQFYAIYDSPNREPLRDAYHESAMLSMSCHINSQNRNSGPRDKAMLNAYQTNNRNLKRVTDSDRRLRYLMSGHAEIMKFLCSLPSSQHDPHSFAVDLLLYTPQLIQLCLCGVFRETGASSNMPVRAFSRSIVIVPQGQGFCIVNETINITNATSAQADAAFKTSLAPVAPVPAVPAPVVPLMPVPVSPSVGAPGQDLAKLQMVEHVSNVSGMNLFYSEECLKQNSWNVEHALHAFQLLQKQGTIPNEAFVR